MIVLFYLFPPSRGTEAAAASLEAEHQTFLAQLNKSHAEELEKVRQQMVKELQELEESLEVEKEIKTVELQKTLASQQSSEELKLKTKQETYLSALKSRLEEEEEEEEAIVEMEKQDALRKLRQQV